MLARRAGDRGGLLAAPTESVASPRRSAVNTTRTRRTSPHVFRTSLFSVLRFRSPFRAESAARKRDGLAPEKR